MTTTLYYTHNGTTTEVWTGTLKSFRWQPSTPDKPTKKQPSYLKHSSRRYSNGNTQAKTSIHKAQRSAASTGKNKAGRRGR